MLLTPTPGAFGASGFLGKLGVRVFDSALPTHSAPGSFSWGRGRPLSTKRGKIWANAGGSGRNPFLRYPKIPRQIQTDPGQGLS